MERAGRGLDFRQQALASLSPPGSTGSEDAPSVQVLNGVGSDAAEPDPKVEQLLIEIGREPAHWNSCRIAIKTDRH